MNELTNIGTVKDLLNRYGFTFSKSLGQNFIINPSICPRIAEMGGAAKGTGIIEIGTGFGVLTRELAARADKVEAVEIDSRLMPVLAETLSGFDNVEVINADVMKTDLRQIIDTRFAGLTVNICANLPYYITSPIIMYLLESRLPVNYITVMVQKEVGERLCAPMGSRECGAVTAAVRYYSEPQRLFSVSRGSFMPAPNVDSCVIRLAVRDKPAVSVKDEKFFFRVVRGAFSQRRKNLANSLSSALGMDKGTIAEVIRGSGLSENVRPEQLTLEELAAVADALSDV